MHFLDCQKYPALFFILIDMIFIMFCNKTRGWKTYEDLFVPDNRTEHSKKNEDQTRHPYNQG